MRKLPSEFKRDTLVELHGLLSRLDDCALEMIERWLVVFLRRHGGDANWKPDPDDPPRTWRESESLGEPLIIGAEETSGSGRGAGWRVLGLVALLAVSGGLFFGAPLVALAVSAGLPGGLGLTAQGFGLGVQAGVVVYTVPALWVIWRG